MNKDIDIIGTAPSVKLWTPSAGRLILGMNRASQVPEYLGFGRKVDFGTHFDPPSRFFTDYSILFVPVGIHKRFKEHYNKAGRPIRLWCQAPRQLKFDFEINWLSVNGLSGSAGLCVQCAALMGFKRIHVWGVEMTKGSYSYFDKKKSNFKNYQSYYEPFLKIIKQVERQFGCKVKWEGMDETIVRGNG